NMLFRIKRFYDMRVFWIVSKATRNVRDTRDPGKVIKPWTSGTYNHRVDRTVLLRALRLGVIMGNLLSSREVQQGTSVIKEQNMMHLISFGKDTLTLNQTRDHIYLLLLLRVDLQTLFMKIIVRYFQLLVIKIHGQFLAYRLTFAQGIGFSILRYSFSDYPGCNSDDSYVKWVQAGEIMMNSISGLNICLVDK
nr:hypothetical protein [Tanacetum cinerariifolium]